MGQLWHGLLVVNAALVLHLHWHYIYIYIYIDCKLLKSVHNSHNST